MTTLIPYRYSKVKSCVNGGDSERTIDLSIPVRAGKYGKDMILHKGWR
jgi:hypothetical protein